MFFELGSSSTRQLGKNSRSQVWQRKYKPGRLPQKVISSLVIGSLILIVGGMLSSMQCGADRIRKIVLFLRNFSRLEQT